MKQIFLLRHAETEHGSASMQDKDRPLTEQGCIDAAGLGHLLKQHEKMPDLILCSTAVRAQETKEHLISTWSGLDKQPMIEDHDDLYLASMDKISEKIAFTDDTVQSVMIIAHNPGIAQAALEYAGPQHLASLYAYAPCTLSLLNYQAESWATLSPQLTELVEVF